LHGNQLDRPKNEKLRLTYIPHPDWLDQTVLEIRIKRGDGRLDYGPHIPIDDVGEFVAGIFNFLLAIKREEPQQSP
jgi:hypothetical protein